MGRDLKHQVGARVPGDLLEKAKQAAAALGVSFNQWVEQAFNLKLRTDENSAGVLRAISDGSAVVVDAPIPGQTTIPIVADPDMEPGTVEIREETATGVEVVGKITGLDGLAMPRMTALGEALGRIDRSITKSQTFARNCTNGTFHWKHGPGNPCRYCKGEI